MVTFEASCSFRDRLTKCLRAVTLIMVRLKVAKIAYRPLCVATSVLVFYGIVVLFIENNSITLIYILPYLDHSVGLESFDELRF